MGGGGGGDGGGGGGGCDAAAYIVDLVESRYYSIEQSVDYCRCNPGNSDRLNVCTMRLNFHISFSGVQLVDSLL